MGKIGPHEGKELALMLANQKPLAYFYTDSEIPDEFEPYFKSGRLYCTTVPGEFLFEGKKVALERYVISHQPNTSDVVRFIEILKVQDKVGWQEDLEREIGQLLGYTQADIDCYIEHAKRRQILTL